MRAKVVPVPHADVNILIVLHSEVPIEIWPGRVERFVLDLGLEVCPLRLESLYDHVRIRKTIAEIFIQAREKNFNIANNKELKIKRLLILKNRC